MPVFDFSNTPDSNKEVVCTYTTFHSNEHVVTPEKPILVLDNRERKWNHYSSGMFTNPIKDTTFEFNEEDGKHKADILQIDSRFVALVKWLGKNHINVRLSGENREEADILALDGCIAIRSLKEKEMPETFGKLYKYKKKVYGISAIHFYRSEE